METFSLPLTPHAKLLSKQARAHAEEPRTRPRQDLEKNGRLDPVYQETGPKLKDALDAALMRPTSTDAWELDDYALPGGLPIPHLI